MPSLDKGLGLFIRHWPPPFVTGQGGGVDVRVVSTGTQCQAAFAGRDEFGDRDAVAGNQDFLPFKREIEKTGELGLGLVDVELGHRSMLVHVSDYVKAGPSTPRQRRIAHLGQQHGHISHISMVKLYGVKKTFNVDNELFREAKAACGATTDTETIRLGLEALVRHAAYERLRALRGAEPHARDVPRRRERPSAKRRPG